MLPITNHMSGSIFYVQSMEVTGCSQILSLQTICEKNADFVFFTNAQVTRKMINLLNLFFMNYVGASARNSLQYLIC